MEEEASGRVSTAGLTCVFGHVALWESSVWLCVLFSEIISRFIGFMYYFLGAAVALCPFSW